jgi:glycosyltransferase involved in cell wall biosynthesis
MYTKPMAKGLPLISVLVCNYNYGRYIKETLDSVLSQTYPNIEIVVIDDGSSDDSVGVIKKYIKSHSGVSITLSAKKKNQGICFARNDAIDLAKGDFLIFLDSDDTIPADYVSVMYATIIKQRADIIYGDVAAFVKSENTFLNYRIQESSRNANHLNMKERTQEVVDVWKYSFEKYQKQFPGKLTQDFIFDFYDHQLSMLGDELMALNDVVQEELVPELKRREIHIEYLNNKSLKQKVKNRIKKVIKKNKAMNPS